MSALSTVYAKTLWEQRRSTLTWGSGIALLIFLESALWPSIRSMPSFDTYLAGFPEGLKELFAIDQMSTGTGFLNAELYSLMLPLMFLVYGVVRGARSVAGEESDGTLDLLLVTPLSARSLLLQKALGLVTGVAVLGLVALGTTVFSSAVFGLGVPLTAALSGALSMTLLGAEFGVVALAAGALSGRPGIAVAVPSALALAAYVLYLAGIFVASLEPWRWLSPFDQALASGPLSETLPGSFALLVLAPLLLTLYALPRWGRRDIGAAH